MLISSNSPSFQYVDLLANIRHPELRELFLEKATVYPDKQQPASRCLKEGVSRRFNFSLRYLYVYPRSTMRATPYGAAYNFSMLCQCEKYLRRCKECVENLFFRRSKAELLDDTAV